MSQRLLDTTKWLWCFIALYAGSFWGPARCVTVRTPPNNPATVEAQAKFFQDFFSVQLSPYKIEFGHVCEDPNTWEQRYEKKDYKNHRDMGKVRWGDKKGGYGEHYWDLNHAGHAGNHGDDGYETGSDDGSYREDHSNDPYDEPSQNAPSYGNEDYDPEKSSYEESGRAKRAHSKVKVERKTEDQYEDEPPKQKQSRKNKEQLKHAKAKPEETSADDDDDDADDNDDDREDDYKKTKPTRHQYRNQEHNKEDTQQPKEHKKQIVLVVSHKEKDVENQGQTSSPYVPKRQPDLTHYVPYESGAGIRQHHQAEVSAAASVPRLFLEPSTGHVVDRSTGQAYVLQPINRNNNYN